VSGIEPNVQKIVNDPVYGFITIPNKLTFDLIEHPWFQRLRRINQLGLTSMVYPGALHTRFHHAIGTMHLMHNAIEVLRQKGNEITESEETGVTLAILLHDIGHGPFSHTLENCIVFDIKHENISALFFQRLNQQFDNKLSVAYDIFTDHYPKHFLHQLVSSQLDMDRLDYLMRDSFFTGVAEGVINTDRIIKMLTVVDDELAVEIKGIYSLEKFIVARRLMYWQVYFHKTVLAAEYMLVNILRRAKELVTNKQVLFASPALGYFLNNHITYRQFVEDPSILELFAELDDYDIYSAVKVWATNRDTVLSTLCKGLMNRNLLKVEIQNEPFNISYLTEKLNATSEKLKINFAEANYLVIHGSIANNAYNPVNDKINVVDKKGVVMDITQASDQLDLAILKTTVSKYFLCYPKWIR
jgi:uncharacterized protein